MVTRILRLIGKEIGGLHEAAYLLAVFAFLSQILALIRDRLLAHAFGATHALDVYYAAFRIPDFIFVTVASMVSLSIIIPFLMEKMEQGEGAAKRFVDDVFSVFFLIMAGVSVIAFVAAPYLLKLFFPTFTADLPIITTMTRIMLLSPIFLGFSNFLASITQVYKRFFIYALSPVVYNIGIVVGIVFLYPLFGIVGLAWGVALGAFLHCAIQIPFVIHKSLFPTITFKPHLASIRRVLFVALPRTITVSSNEISEFVLISMASMLAGGAVSIFNFSWNLQSVPLSIIGVSYSLAAFPALAKLYAEGNTKHFVDQMITSTKHIIFWCLPVMTMFIVLRAQIVRVILGSGQFSWSDTKLTAAALALFVISLIPQSLVILFVRAYYSRGDTKRPLVMNVISAICIILFSFLLVKLFNTNPAFSHFIVQLLRVDSVTDASVLMLPLGFSLGASINLIIHWIAFEIDFPGYTKGIFKSLRHVVPASVLMGIVSYYLLAVFDDMFDIHTLFGVFMQGFLSGIIGLGIGALFLLAMKNKEILDIIATLKLKIWRVKLVPPDPVS